MAAMEQPESRQTEPKWATPKMIEAGIAAYRQVTLFHDSGQELTGDELAIIAKAMVATGEREKLDIRIGDQMVRPGESPRLAPIVDGVEKSIDRDD